MAFRIQSVILLSKLASALGHRGGGGGREGGGGEVPLAPFITDREMEASVSVCQHSNDVTGDTASSNNPAGLFATSPHFGLCSCGTGGTHRWGGVWVIAAVQVASSQREKEEGKNKKQNKACVSSSYNHTNEMLQRCDALLTILGKIS